MTQYVGGTEHGLCGHRLASTSMPIMSEESISLLFFACVSGFVCEQNTVPPVKGLAAMHHELHAYTTVEHKKNPYSHNVGDQVGLLLMALSLNILESL